MGEEGLTMKSPIFLREGEYNQAELKKFQKDHRVWKVRDIYEQELSELFEIRHPDLLLSDSYDIELGQFIKDKTQPNSELRGNWVYFPWSGIFLHIVIEEDYNLLRTNRNRNLITLEEQSKLNNLTIGVVGLSVGGSMAVTLANNGIGRSMKLADYDTLTTTNLNRIRARSDQIGTPKINIVSQQIYEINPYAQLFLFEDGLKSDTLENFCSNKQKPDVIFEAIDDFEMKVRIRLLAKKLRIPIIMLTNLGDSVLVDVERHDTEDVQPFNGLLGDLPEQILNNPIGEKEKIKYAMQIVGIDHIPTKALESLLEINKSLVGRPQLASTVAIGGGLAAYLCRQLVLANLPSGRQILPLDIVFNRVIKDDTNRRDQVITMLKNKTKN